MTLDRSLGPARVFRAGAAGFSVSAAAIVVATAAAVGGALRLVGLDRTALDAREAAIALAALGSTAPEIGPAGSPLLVSLERVAFWLLGAGDAVARLIPALAGLALIVLTVGLRPKLGRAGALAAGLVFAFAPVWVFFGRYLSDEGVAAATIVALLAASMAAPARRRSTVPIAAALVITSGPPALTFLVAFAVSLAATRGAAGALRSWWRETWPEPADQRLAAVLFFVTAVLAATALLQRPEGFAEVIGTPAAWLRRFVDGGPGATASLLGLVAYAPTIAVFGIAGLAAGLRRAPAQAGFLTVWSGVAFFIVAVTGQPLTVAELLLPLTLAAAIGLAVLASNLAEQFRWAEEGAMAAVLVIVVAFAALQASKFAFQTPSSDDGLYFLAIGGLVMAGLLVVLYVALWGSRAAARATGLAALVLLPLGAWANGSGANYSDARVLREPLRLDYVTPDLRHLVANVEAASWNRTRDPHELDIRVDPSLAPLLAWPLREQRHVTWAPARGALEAEAVIRPSGGAPDEGFGPAPFVGATYQPYGHWLPRFPAAAGVDAVDPHGPTRTLARWYLHRASTGQTLESDLVFDPVDMFLMAEEAE